MSKHISNSPGHKQSQHSQEINEGGNKYTADKYVQPKEEIQVLQIDNTCRAINILYYPCRDMCGILEKVK